MAKNLHTEHLKFDTQEEFLLLTHIFLFEEVFKKKKPTADVLKAFLSNHSDQNLSNSSDQSIKHFLLKNIIDKEQFCDNIIKAAEEKRKKDNIKTLTDEIEFYKELLVNNSLLGEMERLQKYIEIIAERFLHVLEENEKSK